MDGMLATKPTLPLGYPLRKVTRDPAGRNRCVKGRMSYCYYYYIYYSFYLSHLRLVPLFDLPVPSPPLFPAPFSPPPQAPPPQSTKHFIARIESVSALSSAESKLPHVFTLPLFSRLPNEATQYENVSSCEIL